jgi:hypothetical protein
VLVRTVAPVLALFFDALVNLNTDVYEISRGLLWNWRSQVRRGRLIGAPAALFLPVQVVNEAVAPDPAPRLPRNAPKAAAATGRIEITLPDGSHVQVDNDVSLTALRRVMTVLRG